MLAMRLRSERPLTAQRVFEDVLYQPLRWPWKTLRLERSSLDEYRERSISHQPSLAELWHENAKLRWPTPANLLGLRMDVAKFRREYLQRRGKVATSDPGIPHASASTAAHLLHQVTQDVDLELFYAVDLQLVEEGIVSLYEPVTRRFQVVKRLSGDQQDALVDALRPALRASTSADTATSFVIIRASFARNAILFGLRGHRRTLLEAGQIAQAICTTAAQMSLSVWPVYEFVDRLVDEAVDADGTEEAALAVFLFTEEGRVREG